MPWLEVPDWRAWEPYAALMSDIPDVTPPVRQPSPENQAAIEDLKAALAESTEASAEAEEPEGPPHITGTLNITLPRDDEWAPPIDEAIAPAEPEPEPEVSPAPEPELAPGQRFPVENEPIREEPRAPLPEPTVVDHVPKPESDVQRERRIAKEALSRSERLRRGW